MDVWATSGQTVLPVRQTHTHKHTCARTHTFARAHTHMHTLDTLTHAHTTSCVHALTVVVKGRKAKATANVSFHEDTPPDVVHEVTPAHAIPVVSATPGQDTSGGGDAVEEEKVSVVACTVLRPAIALRSLP